MSRGTILVVDDKPSMVQLLQRLLADKHHVITAHSGEEALIKVEVADIDVVLTDIKMPGIDGVALSLKLKAQPALAAIPVLMLTGEARREMLESSMNAGAVGFIVKPFVRDALVAKLDRFLSTAA